MFELVGGPFKFRPSGNRLTMWPGPRALGWIGSQHPVLVVFRASSVQSASLYSATSAAFRLSDSFDLPILACLAVPFLDLSSTSYLAPFCFLSCCSLICLLSVLSIDLWSVSWTENQTGIRNENWFGIWNGVRIGIRNEEPDCDADRIVPIRLLEAYGSRLVLRHISWS